MTLLERGVIGDRYLRKLFSPLSYACRYIKKGRKKRVLIKCKTLGTQALTFRGLSNPWSVAHTKKKKNNKRKEELVKKTISLCT